MARIIQERILVACHDATQIPDEVYCYIAKHHRLIRADKQSYKQNLFHGFNPPIGSILSGMRFQQTFIHIDDHSELPTTLKG